MNTFTDEILKNKLSNSYEYFILDNFQEPLNLTKEDFWSTPKQETPPAEEFKRTQKFITNFNLKTGIDLTMFFLQIDVRQLAYVFENVMQTFTEEYGINPLYSYSAPGFTWNAGAKMPKSNLEIMKDKEVIFPLENRIRGEN